MKIHDKEVGFLYNVGAFCDYNDYVVAHPDVSVATAELYKAEIMSREYAKANQGAEVITVDELRSLMIYELKDVRDAVKAAEDAGSKRTVETVDTGKKGKV
jgi:4-diphosphocytidyl-2C-methyl-D-erythritol kinase